VVGGASGIFTELPGVGQVVGCGQVLYRVTDSPVVLLCGTTPAYRSLLEEDRGPDVAQLNANLVALGYATRADLDPSSDYFGPGTAYALERLQARLGVEQTGSLSDGQAVFLPGPLRITKVTATLGTGAGPDALVAQAASTRRQVVVDLDAAQSNVKVGDRVTITLPSNQVTPRTADPRTGDDRPYPARLRGPIHRRDECQRLPHPADPNSPSRCHHRRRRQPRAAASRRNQHLSRQLPSSGVACIGCLGWREAHVDVESAFGAG
jgi:hypothetical protein